MSQTLKVETSPERKYGSIFQMLNMWQSPKCWVLNVESGSTWQMLNMGTSPKVESGKSHKCWKLENISIVEYGKTSKRKVGTSLKCEYGSKCQIRNKSILLKVKTWWIWDQVPNVESG